LEDYAKMKDFKTVSPVQNKQKNEHDRAKMKHRMKNLLIKVRDSLTHNLKLVNDTIKSLEKTIKQSTEQKQTILGKNETTLSAAQKKHLDQLETEITALNNFKKPLDDVKSNFTNKLEQLKSFEFKLNQ
jgi:uncharacterized protein YoxC